MRRVVLVCALLASCQANTSGLQSLDAPLDDAGIPDAREMPDASGVRDAGEDLDAGTATGDAGLPVCAEVPQFSIQVGLGTQSYEGVVRVASRSPLVLLNEDRRLTIILSDEAPVSQRIRVGQEVLIDLQVGTPQWTEARMSLHRIGADGRPAELIYAAWAGAGFGRWSTEHFSVRHDPGPCQTTDPNCGPVQEMNLSVQVQNAQIRVPRGHEAHLGDLTIYNANSIRSVGGSLCDDFPEAWYAGWIAGPPGPPQLRCEQLRPDTCIATPGCVLWGSENFDPGYVCRPAADECEAQTEATCDTGPGCSWDPGDCYCPQGNDCFCAGGPAPKCRTFCGGFGGGRCPASHYCRMDLLQPPACLPLPDAGGLCDWRPDDCRGAPEAPVCGCLGPPGLAEVFGNDCQRRQVGAHGTAPSNQCN